MFVLFAFPPFSRALDSELFPFPSPQHQAVSVREYPFRYHGSEALTLGPLSLRSLLALPLVLDFPSLVFTQTIGSPLSFFYRRPHCQC